MDRSSSTLQYPDVVSRSASSTNTKQAASNYAAGLKMAR